MDKKPKQPPTVELPKFSLSIFKAPTLHSGLPNLERLNVRFRGIQTGLGLGIPTGMASLFASQRAFQERMEPFFRFGELINRLSGDQAPSPSLAVPVPPPKTVRLDADQMAALAAAIRPADDEGDAECWFDRRTGSVHLWDCEPIPVPNIGAVHEQFERLFSPVGRSVTLATIGGVYATGHQSLRAEFHRNCPEVLRPALRGKGRGGTCFDLEALREIATELLRDSDQ